jgi:hypothetical protein
VSRNIVHCILIWQALTLTLSVRTVGAGVHSTAVVVRCRHFHVSSYHVTCRHSDGTGRRTSPRTDGIRPRCSRDAPTTVFLEIRGCTGRRGMISSAIVPPSIWAAHCMCTVSDRVDDVATPGTVKGVNQREHGVHFRCTYP